MIGKKICKMDHETACIIRRNNDYITNILNGHVTNILLSRIPKLNIYIQQIY